MSLFDSKITQNVAEAALKIMQDSTKKEEVIETSEMLSEEISYSAKKAREGKDIGKKGKMFAKISKEAGERYGSEEKGEKVAGAVLAKLRKESFSDLINTYKEKGFKGLNESLIKEEPDNETFTKEIKDQQENSEGKKKKKNGEENQELVINFIKIYLISNKIGGGTLFVPVLLLMLNFHVV